MKAAIKQIVKRFLLLCIPLLLGGNMVYAYPNGVTFEPAESDAETLQGQSDLKNVYEEALKVKKVGAELTFSNNKAYYIKNSRGDLATKDGSLVSTVKTDLGVTASQFAIIRYSGQYYLYSIADKKFICFHNSWISAGTYNIVLNNEDFDPVTITKTDRFTDYPFCINSYMSSNTYYLTTSSSTGNGAVFSRQTADDEEGYHYAIEEAGSFDPTEALTILNAKIPLTPYAVLSDSNTVLTFYYDDQKENRGGMSIGPFNYSSSRSWHNQKSTITTVVFDTSFVTCTSLTSTAYWFYNLSKLATILGIENLKTDNVTNMLAMFYGCSNLAGLDVSGFNTNNVTDMRYMFYGCSNLGSIYVGDGWTTTKVTEGGEMFSNCTQLIGSQGTTYSSNHTDHTYAHRDGGLYNPGYFSAEPSPYAVLSDENTVLTFYYDDQKENRGGMSLGPFYLVSSRDWNDQSNAITTVVFDASFANCTSLTSTAYWFYQLSKITAITGIENLKTDNVTDMSGMFTNCSNLTSIDVSGFKTDNVTNMSGMFTSCFNLTSIDVSGFKTDNVTDMHSMFAGCTNLRSLDLSGFKTDKVTDMRYMFNGCSSLTNLDVSSFKTDNVTDMGYMFYGCSSLTGLDLSGFMTDNVKDMAYMFYGCSSLTSLDLSSFKTKNVTSMNGMFRDCTNLTSLDLSGFNTNNVTDMGHMFRDCTSLTILDLSGFKTDNVTDMSRMFYGCSNLGTIYVGNGWTTKNVTNGSYMFSKCTQLVGGQGTAYSSSHTNHTYAHIDGGSSNPGYFSEVDIDASPYAVLSDNNTVLTFYYDDQKENRGGMSVKPFTFESYRGWHDQRETITTVIFDNSFANCTSLTSTAYWFYELSQLTEIIDIENLETDNVTNMHAMFYGCSSLTNLDVSGFETDNVTDMRFMFNGCRNLTSLDVSGFKTDNVTDMYSMFWECYSLISLDVSGFKTNNVTDMGAMFSNCSKLTNLDISGFKTDNVTDMHSMFDGCTNLTSLDVSGFKTDNVTDMCRMFSGCNLTTLDVRGFKTDNVTDMHSMFAGCTNLRSLDLSGFKTDYVTSMSSMFYGCSGLTSLDLSGFKTDNVMNMNGMFYSCSNLTSLDLSSIKTDNVTNMGEMFSGCSKLETIYVGDGWTTAKVTEGSEMFSNCTQLVGCQETAYNNSHTDYTYAHIDGGATNPGYLSIGTFVTNDMKFNVTNQNAEKTVTYVQGPSLEQITVPSEVLFAGQTFPVTAIADSAFAGLSQLKSVKIPSSVKAAGKDLFAGSPHVAAIIWEAPIKMTQEMAGTVGNNPNLLFYTSDVSNAPDGITNIINSQTKQAERIVLSDGDSNDFFCPEEFTADEITYIHHYQQTTVTGRCQGWESLALPFDVTEITHETNGVITPFGAIQMGHEFDNGTKPFWLYEYTKRGIFNEAEGIEANVPYILSMPNEARLLDEYNLAGNITFKGTNATVKKTSNAKIIKSGDYSFTPSYQNGTSASAYLLNVDQKYDGNPRGSVFVRNDLLERQARPFEAYFRLNGSAGVKSFIGIFDELTDGIRSMDPAKHNGNAEYYQLDGTKRSNLQRGFNIIRTKDNKTQKVFKK